MPTLTNVEKLVVSGFISRNAIDHPKSGTGQPKVLRKKETGRRRRLRTEQLGPKAMFRHLLAMPRMAHHLSTLQQTLPTQMMEMTMMIRLIAGRTRFNLQNPTYLPCQFGLTARNRLRKD